MKPIPISAAKRIADAYGYDQVVIIARRVGDEPDPHGEHVTTYGVDQKHCQVAARIGAFLKHKIMGWPQATAALPAIPEELYEMYPAMSADSHAHEVEQYARSAILAAFSDKEGGAS